MISIITPTYNRAHLISKAIESVINQSYTDWELLIVDDGSKDYTKDVVGSYASKDKRIRYFYLENGGAPRARNYGLYKAKGEFILFLDSDDEIAVSKLEEHFSLFNKEKDLEVIVSKVIKVKHPGSRSIQIDNIKPSTEKSLLVDFISKKIVWKTAAPIWRKNFVLKEKGFDEKLSSSQDFEIYGRLILHNPKVGYIQKYLTIMNDYEPEKDGFKIRKDGHSLKSLKNHLRSRNSIRKSLKKHSFRNEMKSEINRNILYHALYCFKTAFKLSPLEFLKLFVWYLFVGRRYRPLLPNNQK